MTIKFSKLVAGAALVFGALGFAPAAIAATCDTDKKIDIAEMSWPSAAALAHIHAKILGDGFGCEVEVVAGDTVPTSASMLAKGRPAFAPELWTGSILDIWAKGEADGTVSSLGAAISDGAVEGWWIPKYVADANPDLKNVEDLVAYKDLFMDPEDNSKGRIYSCPPGWSCEITNANLFKAYELEDSFNLFSPGSGGNLDASIARAFVKQEPIAFYYWGPTSLMGKYDMVKLGMPTHDAEIFACNGKSDCATPGKTDWPTPPVVKGVAAWLPTEAPIVADYISKVALSNVEVSAILSWGSENKASAEETAENFLKTQEAVWMTWVDADVAAAVKASLN
ncbi:ABC transporter substrate-binding protein [Maritalea sp.]|uniref:ABC transporter substrate-binding protein n=1 Tax=Maritalea sp. TaxID=2003361 RepID=UPI003EF78292